MKQIAINYERKTIEQRQVLRSFAAADCHTVQREARKEHQGHQGGQDGDERGQKTGITGKHIHHQIHHQDDAKI